MDAVTELAKVSDIPEIPSIPSVIDNLTSSSTTNALSANQGRALKSLIDSVGTSFVIKSGQGNAITHTSKIYAAIITFSGYRFITPESGNFAHPNTVVIGSGATYTFEISQYHNGDLVFGSGTISSTETAITLSDIRISASAFLTPEYVAILFV